MEKHEFSKERILPTSAVSPMRLVRLNRYLNYPMKI